MCECLCVCVCIQEACPSLLVCMHKSKAPRSHGLHLNWAKKHTPYTVWCIKNSAAHIFTLILKQRKMMVIVVLCNVSAVTSPRGHDNRTCSLTCTRSYCWKGLDHRCLSLSVCACVCENTDYTVCGCMLENATTLKDVDRGTNSKLCVQV